MIYKPIDVYHLAADVFGQEMVDLNILGWHEKVSNSFYEITIHFPEVIITCSARSKHLIRDLYVKFSIQEFRPRTEFKMNIRMMGQRATVTLKEWLSNYGHSHLSNITNWGGFCLGASTFATLLANTRMTLKEEDWNMLFLSIPNYLKWESREGGPYKQYADLNYHGLGRYTDITQEFNKFSSRLPASVLAFTDRFELVNGPELEAFYNQYSEVKDVGGINTQSAETARAEADQQMKQRSDIIFHGRKVEGKVILGDIFTSSKTVSKQVMESYNNIINNQLAGFNRNLGYQQLKSNANAIEIFGETISF